MKDLSGFLLGGVQTFSKDKKTLVQVFQDEIQQHRTDLDEIRIPADAGKIIHPPCGQRCEYNIERSYLDHGDGDVIRRAKGEFSVQSEIPKH